MKLDQALSLAEDKLRPILREEKARLANEIERMRTRRASSGNYLQGAMLKEIGELAIASLNRRIEQTFVVVKEFAEVIRPRIVDAALLMPIVTQSIPRELDDLIQPLRKHATELGAEKALAQLVDPLKEVRANGLQKGQADLQLFLASRPTDEPSNTNERVLGAVQLVSWLVALPLVVLWIRNPAGQYEPWLALVPIVSGVIASLVKWRRAR